MTAAAAVPTKALETLKRIAKPIPFAPNDDPVRELQNIRTLLKAERHGEALDRMNRLFDSKLLPEHGNVHSILSQAATLRMERIEIENASLTASVRDLRSEAESQQNHIDQLESEISALRAQIPGFGGKA